MSFIQSMNKHAVSVAQVAVAGAAGFFNSHLTNAVSFLGRKIGVVVLDLSSVAAFAPGAAGVAAATVAIQKIAYANTPNDYKKSYVEAAETVAAFALSFFAVTYAGFVPKTLETAIVTGGAVLLSVIVTKLATYASSKFKDGQNPNQAPKP
jgi:ABC-type glycerol-3-phosphate transport system permease component